MRKIIAVSIISTLFLGGCATMFSDKNDKIIVNSKDPEAKILLNGNEIGKGSATYTLPRDRTAMITASKKGCSDNSIQTEQSFNKISLINLLFWPGFIVDAATGAINKADPKEYTVNPRCS